MSRFVLGPAGHLPGADCRPSPGRGGASYDLHPRAPPRQCHARRRAGLQFQPQGHALGLGWVIQWDLGWGRAAGRGRGIGRRDAGIHIAGRHRRRAARCRARPRLVPRRDHPALRQPGVPADHLRDGRLQAADLRRGTADHPARPGLRSRGQAAPLQRGAVRPERTAGAHRHRAQLRPLRLAGLGQADHLGPDRHQGRLRAGQRSRGRGHPAGDPGRQVAPADHPATRSMPARPTPSTIRTCCGCRATSRKATSPGSP